MYQSNNQEFKTVEPDKELKKILKTYVNDRPLYDLSREEIDNIQNILDAENTKKIDEYHASGVIDDYTAKVLHKCYDHSMDNYEYLYSAITQVRGEPEDIFYSNIDNGEIDFANTYYLQHVAPFTSMTLKYTDEHKNPVYITLGRIKNLERVIEKISPTSTYAKKYDAEIKQVWEQYGQNSDVFLEKKKKIPRPIDRVKDIYRCLHIFKYAKNIVDNVERYRHSLNAKITEVKDKYNGNNLDTQVQRKAFFDNPGNHRDLKFIAEMPNGLSVEFMGMTSLFSRSYKDTHEPYEERRQIELEMPYKNDYISLEHARLQVLECNIEIKNINADGFEKENMRVLDKVKRMEDKARRQKHTPLEDGTYPECVKFIRDNFYVRSVKALDEHSFDNASGPMRDVVERYFPHICKKYIADIRDCPSTKFDDAKFLARSDDEYETLAAMDKGEDSISKKNQKSLPKFNKAMLLLKKDKSL